MKWQELVLATYLSALWQEPGSCQFKVARTGSCHSQSVLRQGWLPKLFEVARTSSCHFQVARTGSCHLWFDVIGSGKNRFLPFSNYGQWQELVVAIHKWQEPVLATLKIAKTLNTGCIGNSWWVARTGSCHSQTMGSGKNQFLPLKKLQKFWTQAALGSDGEWQEPVLAISKLCGLARTGSCHFQVLGIGKNWFLPLQKLQKFWTQAVMGSGRNWFSPLWEWQEVVLAIFKWCQNRLEHQGMGVARTMGMVTIIITIIITITIP